MGKTRMITFKMGLAFAVFFCWIIAASGQTPLPSEVVFMDPSVRDPEIILSQLPQEAEVVRLSPGKDGVAQISTHLEGKRDLSAIHIISHGNAGYFVLNGERIDGDFLRDSGSRIGAWGRALAEKGDILLYACNLAETVEGKAFVEGISELTGRDVAASTDITGRIPGGAETDWNLEFQQGVIEAAAIAVNGYRHHFPSSAVYHVTKITDDGTGSVTGSLSWAIVQSNTDGISSASIDFNLESGSTVTLSAALPDITDTVTIDGEDVGSRMNVTVTVSNPGVSTFRVFRISASSQTVNISNMTISGGDITAGGGIAATGGSICFVGGTLNLDSVAVSGSKAISGGGIYVYSSSPATITNSTISGNSATGSGGGIYNDGGNTTITNSTISGNSATGSGGGILNDSSGLRITNSTISGNSATGSGGGIYNDYGLTISNTIIVGNVNSKDYYSAEVLTSNGYNIVGYSIIGANAGGFNAETDILYNTRYGTDSTTESSWTQGGIAVAGSLNLAATLAHNGGPTQTLALGADSFAVASANAGIPPANNWNNSPQIDGAYADQRGVVRTSGRNTAIGAYSDNYTAPYYRSSTSGNWSTTATWEQSSDGSSSWTSALSPPDESSLGITILSGHTVTVDQDVAIDQTTIVGALILPTGVTLTIADGVGMDLTVTGTLDMDGGILTFATDSTLSYGSSAVLLYSGPAAQTTTTNELPTSGAANVTIDNSNGVTLGGTTSISGDLTLTSGLVKLGDNDLTLGENSTVVGSPSATNMVVTNGTGVVKKMFSATGSFTFPVGTDTGSAAYSPATLDFTAGTFNSAWVAVGVVNVKHPHNPNTTNYLNRYWSVSQSGISSFSCDTTFNYLPTDVVGTEAEIYGGQYKEAVWTVLNVVDAGNHRFQETVTGFSDFTGVDGAVPGTQASNINFYSVARTVMPMNWTRGDGDNVLVVAHRGSAVDSDPVDGASYTANGAFGTGSEIGTGNYVVYKGPGNGMTVTGLSAGIPYHFRAYEYNDGVIKIYNTHTATHNPNSQTTLPNVPGTPSATIATAITETGFTANWSAATGATGYLLDVSTVSDFSSYVSGYQGKDVGNVTTCAVVGLTGVTTYYYRIRAENTGGTSANSNTISVTTPDGTGVPEDVQNAAPNNGDGNGDGIRDSQQTGVVSLPSATPDASYLTVALTGCGQLHNVVANTYASVGEADPGYDHPLGLVGFDIPCASATVRVYYHGVTDLEGYIYRKYGPTPSDWSTSIWYTMPGVAFGSEEIGGKAVPYVEFALTEAQLGDDTPTSPIIDQGGIARAAAIPTMNEWGMIILALLMIGTAFFTMGRRKIEN